ncbi:MAG TPA: hypothetical protein VGH48_12715, partial [Caldimonas sp.]
MWTLLAWWGGERTALAAPPLPGGAADPTASAARPGALRPRLCPVPAPASTAALPLARLLGHVANAVAAVRSGRSLNDALARCPLPARPGSQALAFHALRWLGAAEVVRG